MRRCHQEQNHKQLMPVLFRRTTWITGDTLRQGENRLSYRDDMLGTHTTEQVGPNALHLQVGTRLNSIPSPALHKSQHLPKQTPVK